MINGHPAYEPAIPFLGVHLRETCTRVHQMTGPGTLIAALFTIFPEEKQLKHLATVERKIQKLWRIVGVL